MAARGKATEPAAVGTPVVVEGTAVTAEVPPVTAEVPPAKAESQPEIVELQGEATTSEPAVDPEPEPAGPEFVVQACAVLRTLDGSERYIYGPVVIDIGAFTTESVEHAISVGAIVEHTN